jgi:hypothetical protein
MLLAVAALIAALAGTAVAVDKITSRDIAKDAVRAKHTDLIRFERALTL